MAKKAVINYKNGQKNGRMDSWYENGELLGIADFIDDHHSGTSYAWYRNGKIKAIGNFKKWSSKRSGNSVF